MDSNLGVTNSKSNSRKLVGGGVAREGVTLLAAVVLGAWDGVVDCLGSSVVNECQSGTGVSNSCVTRAVDSLAVHGSRSRLEGPEALTVVDSSVDDLVTGGVDSFLVNVAECVEGVVALSSSLTQMSSEELCIRWDQVLGDQVLHWGLNSLRLDGVDAAPSQTEQTVSL